MNSFNVKSLELFIFYAVFCEFFGVRNFHFVKSDTFAVKVGQEVGLKVGQKSL